jgi:hypothetical protein
MNVVVTMVDGTNNTFPDMPGTFMKTVDYEGGFVVVNDELGRVTAFPQQFVSSVIETPGGVEAQSIPPIVIIPAPGV